MAFNNENLSLIGGARGSQPAIYSYFTTDTLSSVLETDYFLLKKGQFEEGDLIHINTSDGFNTLKVKKLNGVITTSSFGHPQNIVYVNSINDLPEAASNVITLEDNKNYVFGADLAFGSNRIVLGANNSLTSNNIFSPQITFDGSGSFITGVDVNLTVDKINITCPSAIAFDLSRTSPSASGTINITDSRVEDCDKFAVLDDIRVFDVANVGVANCNSGVVVTGLNWAIFSCSKFALISTSGSYVGIDFGSSIQRTLELDNLILIGGSGSIGIKGGSNSSNVTANFLATVSNGTLNTVTTPLSGISREDVRWEFSNCSGVDDSAKTAGVHLSATRRVTNAGAGVFSKIGGTDWLEVTSERFTTDNTGTMTYISEIDSRFDVHASATLDKVVGGADQLALRIAKNGVTIANSEVVTSNTTPTGLSSMTQVLLTNGDTIDVYIANLDSANQDTDVLKAVSIISRS